LKGSLATGVTWFVVLALLATAVAAQPAADERREAIEAPAPDGSGRLLPITVLRPQGAGPFPLVIVNHGSPPAHERASLATPVFSALTDWFLRRGYAVALPLRRGYGAVGGNWDESYGNCARPDYHKAGIETARDIEAALTRVLSLPYVQPRGTVIVGQSAGGWGTIALAARPHPSIAGLVNFAGGRGGHKDLQPNSNCSPDSLVSAAGKFGRDARTPMVWIYTENDSFFAPPIAQAMHKAFVAAGGVATFHLLPPFGNDGHALMAQRAGVVVWQPIVDDYLRTLPLTPSR
jgi:dienelactone hydrolase